METQELQTLMKRLMPPECEIVTITSLESSELYGVWVNASTITGQEMQLVPLFPGGNYRDIAVGDQGLAILAASEPNQGFYLAGILLEGLLPEGWDNSEHLVMARTRLRLRSSEGITLETDANEEAKGAARTGDAVQVTIPATPAGGATMAALATALLLTGAFMPSGATPISTPPALPIDLTGRITGGSARISIGGGDV